MYTSLVLLAVLLGLSSAASSQCNIPPRFWCTSRRVARLCDVEQQCEPYFAYRSSKRNPTAAAPRVNITLYYETLCGGCRNFIRTQYYPAFKKIGSIMNVNLVPYGNAQELPTADHQWKFTCQHGEEECIGNLIETCTIHNYPNASDFFPFIYCIESSPLQPRQAAPTCASQYNIDYSSIEPCVNGALGNYLEHQMALKTQALNPPHQYVPWITVNGVHTNEIEQEALDDLVQLICKTYTSSQKPAGCTQTEKVYPSVRPSLKMRRLTKSKLIV